MLATSIVKLLQLLATDPCFLFPDCKEHPVRELGPFFLELFDGLFPLAVIFEFPFRYLAVGERMVGRLNARDCSLLDSLRDVSRNTVRQNCSGRAMRAASINREGRYSGGNY